MSMGPLASLIPGQYSSAVLGGGGGANAGDPAGLGPVAQPPGGLISPAPTGSSPAVSSYGEYNACRDGRR
jgi:hypothetical protein